jgi:hypothetical protein
MGSTLPERLGRLPPIVYRGGVIRQISAGHRLLRDPVQANLVNTGRRARVPLDRRNLWGTFSRVTRARDRGHARMKETAPQTEAEIFKRYFDSRRPE